MSRTSTRNAVRCAGPASAVAIAVGVVLGVVVGGCERPSPAPDPETAPTAPLTGESDARRAEEAGGVVAVEDPEPSVAPTADQILARHAAIAGGGVVASARTFRMELTIEAPDPFGMGSLTRDGTVTVWRKAPNLLRTFTEIESTGSLLGGFDGQVGWAIDPDGSVRLLQDVSLSEIRREAVFDREIHLRRVYPHAELLGPVERNGVPAWAIRLRDDDGGDAVALFDRDSGLLMELGRQVASPMGMMPIVQRFENWREFDGVLFPAKVTTRAGNTVQTTTLVGVETGEVADELFAVPEPPESEQEPPSEP